MPHTYECALRWADMDMLGHVNNVRYLEYVAAARDAMFDGLPAAAQRCARTGSSSPHRSSSAVRRSSWTPARWPRDDHVALAHEVYDETQSGRVVHLRVSTVLDHRLDPRELELAEGFRGPDHEWRPNRRRRP